MGLKFLKNNAIWGDSRECIIFVKFQYPEVFYTLLKIFKATFYSSFTNVISCDDE